jgi:hypothetical protein
MARTANITTDDLLTGRLHIYVAFDWGDEINLDLARQQATGVVLDMVRRPRTPHSIAYRPPPLRFPLKPGAFTMPGLTNSTVPSAEATVFDFGGVSVALQLPFCMTRSDLRQFASGLNESAATLAIMKSTRAMLEPLFEQLLPTITRPLWAENFWEEYFVFQFPPCGAVAPDSLLGQHSDWLAGLLRLAEESLSKQEVEDALRLTLRYGAEDVFIPDWGAAVLVDREGESEETLQAIEFANLQLLEYRHIDQRVDRILTQADDLLRRVSQSWLPAWRGYKRPLRTLGHLKVEASGLFERTGNVLKLVGDQYLARVYRLLATRFHLPDWEQDIRRKLDILEGVYQVVSHQASSFRAEFLELTIVILIVIEILLGLFRH